MERPPFSGKRYISGPSNTMIKTIIGGRVMPRDESNNIKQKAGLTAKVGLRHDHDSPKGRRGESHAVGRSNQDHVPTNGQSYCLRVVIGRQ